MKPNTLKEIKVGSKVVFNVAGHDLEAIVDGFGIILENGSKRFVITAETVKSGGRIACDDVADIMSIS